MKLVCEYEGEIIAYGEAKVYEEFIFVDIPDRNTIVFHTCKDFKNWLDKSKAWRIA